MSINHTGSHSTVLSTEPISEEVSFTHEYYAEHSTEIVSGDEISKEFDELRLSYPSKEEGFVGGKYHCNRDGCGMSFKTNGDRK